MFYKTDTPHGLPHNPFNALVVPRPIGWISTVSKDGTANLAPYSFFNAVAYNPPQVMFAASGYHVDGGMKDTVQSIADTGEFVVNIATWDLREAMNKTSVSGPRDVDEFHIAGLNKEPSELLSTPRVKESPIHLECRLTQTVELPKASDDEANIVTFGEVIGIHISDDIMTDGMVDMVKADLIGRMGYQDYTRITDIFTMSPPNWPVD